MSLPRYPKYKDSGVEWLGEVPGHWGIGSIRWLTRRYSGGTPDKTNLAYWEDGTIPWLNSGAVNDRVIREPSTYITADAFSNSSAKWIPEGSLVMALAGQGKTKGMVAQLAIPSTCNQSMAAIIPGSEIAGPFLFWWLDSNYQNIRNMAGGDLRDGLNLELLGNIQCPLPTPVEQTKIAAFLDRETAKIDGLVAEQRRLVELLKEKRQAVISHAVTKGLNPHAPMKHSGIEWLGDVPAHWEVKPLKAICELFGRIGYRGYTTADIVDEGEGAITLSPSNMADGVVSVDKSTYISWEKYSESPEIMIHPGDIVMVKTGSTFGKVAYVSEVSHPTTINPQLVLYKNITCDSRFLFFILNAEHIRALINVNNTGSSIPTMTQEAIGNFRFGLPPKEEQGLVVEFIDSELVKLDTLTAEAQRAINLLQERRTALISAAVTGQIDVRQLTELKIA